MKTLLLSIAVLSVVLVAALSMSPVEPLYATCASSDNLDLVSTPYQVQVDENGDFQFLIQIQGWQLTFDPDAVNIYVDTNNTPSYVTMQYDPSSIWVAGKGCIFDPQDPEDFYDIDAYGEINDEKYLCNGGGVYTAITIHEITPYDGYGEIVSNLLLVPETCE